MIKKLLLAMLLLLSSCATEETAEDEYIDPAKDVFIFSRLSAELQEKIEAANKGRDYDNYQFEMLFKESFDGQLNDIYGDPVDLGSIGDYVLEISSVTCSHCVRMLGQLNELSDSHDLQIVQYFNNGSNDEIIELYAKEDVKMSERIIVIGEDERMKDYVKDYLGISFYPTMVFYDDNEVSFDFVGEFDAEKYQKLIHIAYEDRILREDLLDEKGRSYLEMNRSLDDVRESLSKENQEKIAHLDNDGYTAELTYSLMGNAFDFEKTSNRGSAVYDREIDDFTVYADEPLAIIYTTLENGEEDIAFINGLIGNDDISYVVVEIESANSLKYRNLKSRLKCPLVSHLAAIPDDFYRFGIIAYPSAVFVNKGVFTGAYSNIADKEMFDYAKQIFLKEGSIALKKNNQNGN